MANAWPAAVREDRSGWLVRWADGFTRRGNSALPIGGGDKVLELVAACEAFYRARQADPIFQVSSASAPAELAVYLTDRGYQETARTFVAHAPTEDVIGSTSAGRWSSEATSEASDQWFDVYWSVESARGRSARDAALCRKVFLMPALPHSFVGVRHGTDVAAVGEIVVEDGWAGVQCMTTSADHRRGGAATAVLHRLAIEARSLGAEGMYLAVMADNDAARSLYETAGFQISHEYRYFTAPADRPKRPPGSA